MHILMMILLVCLIRLYATNVEGIGLTACQYYENNSDNLVSQNQVFSLVTIQYDI